VIKEDIQHKHVTWISGMPRSGTTWLSQIFASSPDVRLKFCPLFSYEFKNKLDQTSNKADWVKLFNDVYQTESEYLDQDYLRNKGLVPSFINKKHAPEHLVIKSTRFHQLLPNILRLHSDIKFVHIVRHPCASLYSWLSNPYEFPSSADPLLEWKTGNCRKNGFGEFWGFSDWKWTTKLALELEKLYQGRFKVIRYEDLMQSPTLLTQELFNFCGLKYEQSTEDFLMLSHSKHDENKRSVFKSPEHISQWREHLDPKIVNEIFGDIEGTELEQFGLDKIVQDKK
jgi:hypothetical protein